MVVAKPGPGTLMPWVQFLAWLGAALGQTLGTQEPQGAGTDLGTPRCGLYDDEQT